MDKSDIYNEDFKDQIKKAIMEQIADESQKVNHAISEIKYKIQMIATSKLSKDTKKRKIKEITDYITKNSVQWIEHSNDIASSFLYNIEKGESNANIK
jgi:hypothetical protein